MQDQVQLIDDVIPLILEYLYVDYIWPVSKEWDRRLAVPIKIDHMAATKFFRKNRSINHLHGQIMNRIEIFKDHDYMWIGFTNGERVMFIQEILNNVLVVMNRIPYGCDEYDDLMDCCIDGTPYRGPIKCIHNNNSCYPIDYMIRNFLCSSDFEDAFGKAELNNDPDTWEMMYEKGITNMINAFMGR